MTSNGDQCPICWEEFKQPKLLSCRHSFCCNCLKSYVRKSRGRQDLACPICRQVWTIPGAGVEHILTNYFLEDAFLTRVEELLPCEFCKNLQILKTCSHCGQTMCSACGLSHREALRLAGESNHLTVFDNKESNGCMSDSDSDDSTDSDTQRRRRNSSSIAIPFSLSISLPPIRTNCKVRLISTFFVESELPGSSDRQFINCIYPISEDECWIIPTAGPDLVCYTWDGQKKQTIHLGSIITSLVCQPDGKFLISLWGEKAILTLLNQNNACGFASTRNIHPHSMANFPDGRVVYAGPSINHSEETDHKTRKKKHSEGSLTILSKTGALIREVKHDGDGPLFENPAAVAVSPTYGTIAVGDKAKGCVYLLSQEGDILTKYTGGNRQRFPFLFNMEENAHFLPLNLCFDRRENLLILDASSRIIHTLNPHGEFTGLIAPGDIEEFSHPFSIAVDKKNRLWIGDETDHCVRVFEICQYVNNFSRENND